MTKEDLVKLSLAVSKVQTLNELEKLGVEFSVSWIPIDHDVFGEDEAVEDDCLEIKTFFGMMHHTNSSQQLETFLEILKKYSYDKEFKTGELYNRFGRFMPWLEK